MLYALLDADDDTNALAVLDTLPDWVRPEFRTYFATLLEREPKWQRFYIGDTRIPEQVAADIARDDAFLRRCGDTVLTRL